MYIYAPCEAEFCAKGKKKSNNLLGFIIISYLCAEIAK